MVLGTGNAFQLEDRPLVFEEPVLVYFRDPGTQTERLPFRMAVDSSWELAQQFHTMVRAVSSGEWQTDGHAVPRLEPGWFPLFHTSGGPTNELAQIEKAFSPIV